MSTWWMWWCSITKHHDSMAAGGNTCCVSVSWVRSIITITCYPLNPHKQQGYSLCNLGVFLPCKAKPIHHDKHALVWHAIIFSNSLLSFSSLIITKVILAWWVILSHCSSNYNLLQGYIMTTSLLYPRILWCINNILKMKTIPVYYQSKHFIAIHFYYAVFILAIFLIFYV